MLARVAPARRFHVHRSTSAAGAVCRPSGGWSSIDGASLRTFLRSRSCGGTRSGNPAVALDAIANPEEVFRMWNWIHETPLALLAMATVLGSAALCVAGVWLVDRCGWRLKPEDNESAGFRHAFAGVVYAVALALIVVAAHERHGSVEQSILAEANAVGDLYRTLDAMPHGARERLQQLLVEYVNSEVSVEWDIVRRGGTSEHTWGLVDDLMRQLQRFEPANHHDELVQDRALKQAERLLDARRTRLFTGQRGVGEVAWAAIIAGAVITLGFACFFHGPSLRAHMLMMAMAGAMFGLMVFLLIALDQPLRGRYGIDPTDLENQLILIKRMQTEQRP